MIGELINKFDNLEDDSFKAFKSLFKTSLDYPNDCTVTIGRVLTGDSRELIIGDTRLLQCLLPLERGTKKKVDTTLSFIVNDHKGNELYRAKNAKDLAEKSHKSVRTMKRYETFREGYVIHLTLPEFSYKTKKRKLHGNN
jgi:hypothetical protein|tara:strand:- start:208 stop:627 length:420 start_codon:yes stop_codon:yes gene_type:complete